MRTAIACGLLLFAVTITAADLCMPGQKHSVHESVYAYACAQSKPGPVRVFDQQGNYLRTIEFIPGEAGDKQSASFYAEERFAALIGAPSCVQGEPHPAATRCVGRFMLACPRKVPMIDIQVDMPPAAKVSVVRTLKVLNSSIVCRQKYDELSRGEVLEGLIEAEPVQVTVVGLTKAPFTYPLNFAALDGGKVAEPPPDVFRHQKAPRGGTAENGAEAAATTVQFKKRKN